MTTAWASTHAPEPACRASARGASAPAEPAAVARILGRYDAAALRRLFAEALVLRALEERGFADLEVAIESEGLALPHVVVLGAKGGPRRRLIDAVVVEASVAAAQLARLGAGFERELSLLVVSWLREQDPTRSFSAERPALPLQAHPGLGVLRRAFAVVLRIARELGKDGVGNRPKLFHDAWIFFRSRMFLFLDGCEQGRFEALVRDLRPLALGDASLALVNGCVRDAAGVPVVWQPGLQVFPLSPAATAYFNAPEYAAAVARGFAESRFVCDPAALAATRALLAEAARSGAAPDLDAAAETVIEARPHA
jgi:hypothetical protein